MTQLLHALILGACFLALFGTGELLFHFAKVKGELTRKLIHFGTGIITLFFPVYLQSHWYVLLLCGSFAIILTLSLKFDFLKSINSIDRKSHGSISYPAAVYGTFLAYSYNISGNGHDFRSYYIPILILAICDPLAALLGKRFPFMPFKVGEGKKTVTGTSAFFIAAFVLSYFLVSSISDRSSINDVTVALTLAFVTTITEAVSRNGFDNLLIPAASILVLYFFSHYTHIYSFD